MNRTLRLLSLLAVTLFASNYAFGQNDYEYDLEVDGIYYKYDTDKLIATVVHAPLASPYKGNITIPATFTRGRFTFNVNAINQGAFNNSQAESVTILSDGENGVTTIAESAFSYSRNLKKVTLPNTLKTIGKQAFSYCTALSSIVIPSSVKSINKLAFNNCSSLTNVTFPNEMPVKSIEDEAFYGCGMTTITLPKGVLQAGKEAFAKCKKLTKVNFPDDYQVISQEMFSGCSSLEEITFPSSIWGINSMAFYSCPLKKVEIPSTITDLGWDAFLYCDELTEFVILDSEEELRVWSADGDDDFTNLKTFYLGRNLNYIDNNIIRHLNPSNLTIGPKVTNLLNCFGDNLKEITCYIKDPTSVPEYFSSKVKANAVLKVPAGSYDLYCNTKGWKDFFFIEEMAGVKPSVGEIFNLNVGGNEISFKVTSNDPMEVEVVQADPAKVSGSISIPKTVKIDGYNYSVTSIGEGAFMKCSGLTSISIPNSVTSTGTYAFALCSGLTSVTIPNSVTTIGIYAFYKCTGLTSVTIPNSVRIIGGHAFYNCSSLTSVAIPNSVTSIGEDTFSACSGLTSVTIPNSVTGIGNSAFSSCTSLTSVTIPNSVTSIGKGAFSGCSGLTSIIVESGNTTYDSRNKCNAIIETKTNKLIAGCKNTIIPNSVTIIDSYAFSGCSGLTSVTIPNSVTGIGNSAFSSCTSLTSVTIGNSVTIIGGSAFSSCISLTSVTIGNSVTSIGNSAFRDCISLTSVTIPNSVTDIEIAAFNSCTSLTSVIIGNSVTSIGWYAFQYCSSLNDVYCYAYRVPRTDHLAFDDIGKATLHVPASSINSYKYTALWSYFGSIVALKDGDPSGIERIYDGEPIIDNAPTYNLSGQRINKAGKGIYIKNGKKVLVK